MKKISFLTFVIVILFSACNSSTSKDKNKAKTPTAETKTGTIHLTKEEFLQKVVNYEKNSQKWVYLGDKPCIIDFYATWCPPCKAIAPDLEELADKYKDEIYIYKIDTDKEPELAKAFGIRSIPTLYFCNMDNEVQRTEGAMPKENFEQIINEVLLKKEK